LNPDTNGFQKFSFRDAPAILYRGRQNRPLQNNTGHFSSAFTMDVYTSTSETLKKECQTKMEQVFQRVSTL
jgi:hypothetical protein